MHCGIFLFAGGKRKIWAKGMWAELLHVLSCEGTCWQVDQLMVEGTMDEGIYASDALAAALANQYVLQEARIVLLPAGETMPDELPDWDAFLNSPAIAAIYFYDWCEFEIYTKDAAVLARLAQLAESAYTTSFRWIDDGDIGRTWF